MTTNLTGKALRDRATELNIQGRSKMSADELRQAIIEADTANLPEADRIPVSKESANFIREIVDPATQAQIEADFGMTAEEEAEFEEIHASPVSNTLNGVIEAPVVDEWKTLPNREERRKAARRQRKAAGRIAQKQNKRR